jgi:hypothetical protein
MGEPKVTFSAKLPISVYTRLMDQVPTGKRSDFASRALTQALDLDLLQKRGLLGLASHFQSTAPVEAAPAANGALSND